MTVGRDSTLRLWNAGTLQHTRTVQMPDQSWCTEALYCEAQGKLVLATVNSRLLLYDATNLRQQKAWRLTTVASALTTIEQPVRAGGSASARLCPRIERVVTNGQPYAACSHMSPLAWLCATCTACCAQRRRATCPRRT